MTIRRYVATMQIRGARILLTGASGGLGEAIARELASKGAHLVLTARRAEVLEALAADLNAEVLVADLADRADQDRVCEAAEDCDAVIANAGIDREPGLSPDRVEVLDRVLEVNLRAPMVLAQRYASSRIASGKQGAIVFMGSLASLSSNPGTRMYCATKFGLRGYSLALSQELEGTGVTASLVLPGFIRDAGMFYNNELELPTGVRTSTPQDVANAVVVALTDAPMEVYVAPPEMRLGAKLSTVAPRFSSWVMKRVGAAERTGAAGFNEPEG